MKYIEKPFPLFDSEDSIDYSVGNSESENVETPENSCEDLSVDKNLGFIALNGHTYMDVDYHSSSVLKVVSGDVEVEDSDKSKVDCGVEFDEVEFLLEEDKSEVVDLRDEEVEEEEVIQEEKVVQRIVRERDPTDLGLSPSNADWTEYNNNRRHDYARRRQQARKPTEERYSDGSIKNAYFTQADGSKKYTIRYGKLTAYGQELNYQEYLRKYRY